MNEATAHGVIELLVDEPDEIETLEETFLWIEPNWPVYQDVVKRATDEFEREVFEYRHKIVGAIVIEE